MCRRFYLGTAFELNVYANGVFTLTKRFRAFR
jgi:hypothetical protein